MEPVMLTHQDPTTVCVKEWVWAAPCFLCIWWAGSWESSLLGVSPISHSLSLSLWALNYVTWSTVGLLRSEAQALIKKMSRVHKHDVFVQRLVVINTLPPSLMWRRGGDLLASRISFRPSEPFVPKLILKSRSCKIFSTNCDTLTLLSDSRCPCGSSDNRRAPRFIVFCKLWKNAFLVGQISDDEISSGRKSIPRLWDLSLISRFRYANAKL